MRAANLQEFLRKLAGPFGAIGLPGSTTAALESCAAALEPFRDLELDRLADFLRRADEARRAGTVPLAEVPAVAPVCSLARQLSEDMLVLEAADGPAADLEARVNRLRHDLQHALVELARSFGIVLKCSEVPHWPAILRGRRLVAELRAKVTGPESYHDPVVTAFLARLTDLGDAVLKSLAAELGLPVPKSKGAKLAEDLIAGVTGHRPPGAAPARGGRKAATGPDPNELIRVLKERLARVQADPYAVSDAEAEELMARYKALKLEDKKRVVSEVLGVNVRSGEDGLLRLKSALIGLRLRLQSQKA